MARMETLDVDVTALEAYLREHIPITRAMDVSVEFADVDRVVLRAPLEPNINHRDTVFGGSASALAILAGWTLVHLRMRWLGHSPRRIVIQRNRMEYLRPIEGEFRAVCQAPGAEAWSRFLRILDRRRMGRISLDATLRADGEVAGLFHGDYVAMEDGSS